MADKGMQQETTQAPEADVQKGKFMTFKSGHEYFGIELKYIIEIIAMQSITAIPETEEYIKGLINLRGKIIPVIDVRLRFKQEPFEYTDRTCIIIIDVSGTTVGLIIETISGVVTIEERNIEPPPSLSIGNAKNRYVYGLGKTGDTVKLLLDPQKLIKDEELALFDEISLDGEMQQTEQEEN